jgi:predicted HicB family RNase H-like nuclease
MAKNNLVTMGFRASEETHRKITDAAIKQSRSIANLLNILIEEQVIYYEKAGWEKAIPAEDK